MESVKYRSAWGLKYCCICSGTNHLNKCAYILILNMVTKVNSSLSEEYFLGKKGLSFWRKECFSMQMSLDWRT